MRLWKDEAGAILSAELVLLMTITVIGLIVGMRALAGAVNAELADLGSAIGRVDQSFSYGGSSYCCARTYGSAFNDKVDTCDSDADIRTNGRGEVQICQPGDTGEGSGADQG